MTRSLFVIENGHGEFWMPRRERDDELEQYGANSHASDPTAGIVEYVPRVRCDGCKHYNQRLRRCYHDSVLRIVLREPDWYCADHEPKEEP